MAHHRPEASLAAKRHFKRDSFLQNFTRDDRHIAAGSAACTARRLRPFPCARGGNGNTQNRNATAMSSLMAHIPHGVGQHPLFPFWLRAIDGSEPCGETLLQARRLLRDFARIDRHIAAGSAACTARRLRPFPYARGVSDTLSEIPVCDVIPLWRTSPMVQTKKLSVLRALRRGGGVLR